MMNYRHLHRPPHAEARGMARRGVAYIRYRTSRTSRTSRETLLSPYTENSRITGHTIR
ncbi:protein of unknown function [Methanoculleus bourgensis]|uniref:Uncharacterized protein n=1 Tax=Methanoculleus bourgensis TaxID=83986 RepID=A0A0X3BM65_9EURY|nr:protein of unknown function [Methanoculleus bourgensis]